MIKPSYQTGEFWLYILAGCATVYLESRGMTVDDLTKKGAVFVTSVVNDPTFGKYALVVLAGFFGITRNSLKKKELEMKRDVELSKIKQGIDFQ